MRELIYAMRFTGRTWPVGSVGHVLKATTTAPSLTLSSTVGPTGLASALGPAEGGEATFVSELTFTGETSFQEIGWLTFGMGNRLHISTVGTGYLSTSTDPTRRQGTAMLQVNGGDGQFADASGLITSNFFIAAGGEVTDHQFGVIFLR